MAHGQVAVELGEQEGQHVDTEEGRQDIESPVSGWITLLDVKQAQIVDGETGQRVAHAGVEHEDEAILDAQRAAGRDAHGHRAGHQDRTGGEQDMEDEHEEVTRGVKIDR